MWSASDANAASPSVFLGVDDRAGFAQLGPAQPCSSRSWFAARTRRAESRFRGLELGPRKAAVDGRPPRHRLALGGETGLASALSLMSQRQREQFTARRCFSMLRWGECTLTLWGSLRARQVCIEGGLSDNSADRRLHSVLHRCGSRRSGTSRIRDRPRQAVANPRPAPPSDPVSAPQQADAQENLTPYHLAYRLSSESGRSPKHYWAMTLVERI